MGFRRLLLTCAAAALSTPAYADLRNPAAGVQPFTATGGNTSRPAADRAGDRLTPFDFGAKGDCATDDTAKLQAFFNVGGYLPIPSGGCYKVTASVKVPSNVSVQGAGPAALIKLVLPAGTPAVPVLDLSGSGIGTTSNISLSNFAVDGGNAVGLAAPTIYSANIAAGAAVAVQSSYTTISRLWVNNAWDNGVGIGILSSISRGNPTFVTVDDILCYHDGYGAGGGACVDNLSGSRVVISNSVDNNSAVGFIADYGAGAVTVMSNLVANNNARDGFYIGAPDTTLANLSANFSGWEGMWVDVYAQGNGGSLTGFQSENAQRSGLLVMASGWTISTVQVKNASSAGTGLYDAISVQNPGYASQNLTGTTLFNAVTSGSKHRYGYNEVPGSTYTISVQIVGGNFQGVTGGIASGTGTAGLTATGTVTAPAYASAAATLPITTTGTQINLGTLDGTGLQITDPTSGADSPVKITAGKTGVIDTVIQSAGSVNLRMASGGHVKLQPTYSVQVGSGSILGTTATNGFLMLPAMGGLPTGTPNGASSAFIPQVVDTTDSKVCFYIGSAWKCATLQ